MRVPDNPRLYHITHSDNLRSISGDGHLWSDAEREERGLAVVKIGMDKIKARRLEDRKLTSSPGLAVGECVPFNFCHRSVMLHNIHSGAAGLAYRGGQEPVVHLEVDLWDAVEWAQSTALSWAFTTANASATECADYNDLARLDRIDWDNVLTPDWMHTRKDKTFEEAKAARQAEFLLERALPWTLVRRIGVYSNHVREGVMAVLDGARHVPDVVVQPTWYY